MLKAPTITKDLSVSPFIFISFAPRSLQLFCSVWAPCLTFTGRCQGGAIFVSFVVCSQLLLSKRFLSCQAASLVPLQLERLGFCWGFYYMYPLEFLGCQLPPCLRSMRQKENTGNSLLCSSSMGILAALASSLHLSDLFWFVFLYNIQGFQVLLRRKNRKKQVYSGNAVLRNKTLPKKVIV